IYLLKLDEYLVVALPRAAAFPQRVRGQVYAFGALSDADLSNLRRDGRNFAKVLGFPLPAVQAGVDVPRWIVSDPASDHFGEEVSLELITSAERFISRDAVALVMLSEAEGWVSAENVQLSDEPDWKAEKRAGPGRDRRVLPQTGVSAQTVSLAQLVALLKSVDVDDWPFEGPKALVEFLAAVVSSGHSLSSYWGFWVAQSGVARASAVAQELKNIVEVLHRALVFDALDVSNLASFELLSRRGLQIQRAVKRCPRQPSFEGLELMVDAWVADQQKARSTVLKQERMYREEADHEDKKYRNEQRDEARTGSADIAQESALRRIRRRIAAFGDRPADLDGAGALQELLKTRGVYGGLDASTTVVDFDPSRLNILREEHFSTPLDDVAPRSVRDVMANFDSAVVRPLSELTEDEPLVQPYWDPQLDPRRRGTRPALVAFLRALALRGLVGARARRKSCISAFFVRKKNGDQRMVLDARQANQLQRLPPKTALASGEALAAINLVDAADLGPDDLDIVINGGDLVAGSVDLQDGFYQFRHPAWGSWMCFDIEVSAGELGVTQLYDEDLGRYIDISPDSRVWPCFEALPMGWSWALWICQEVLIDTMSAVFGEKDSWCLDKGKPPSLLNGGVAHAPYVDNANLISLDAAQLDERLGAVTDELDKRGLRWHELQHAALSQGILGLEFDGRHGRLRHASRRAWRLHLGLHEVLRRPRLARWQVRRLLGHIVHYFSIMRPALSVLGECYAYLESGPMEGVSRLPPSVVTELRCAAGLVFLGQVDLRRPPAPVSFTTDSSMLGYAVCEAELFGHEVLGASRWRERQRFKEVEVSGDPDRDAYLGRAAGLDDVSDLCHDELGDAIAGRPRRQARARRRRQEMEVGHPPPPLPPELIDPQRWTEAFRGAWRHPGRIHSLEARASVIGLGAAARQANCHGTELLSLSDNLSSVLSFEKGRASNRELLAQCRRAGALQLGAEITRRVRHVPGCVNVADWGSRAADRRELLPGWIRGAGFRTCPPAPSRGAPVVRPSGGSPGLGPGVPGPSPVAGVAFATRPTSSRVSEPPGPGEKPVDCTGQWSEDLAQ
ncbi:unnamed protein product, partial [Prorocentrum cordatum]